MNIEKPIIKTLVFNYNKVFLHFVLFMIEFQLQNVKSQDSTKSTSPNPISFDKAKRLQILKPDLNSNDSFLKANRKVFKNIFGLCKYMKIFGFSPNCLILQIDIIDNCKLFALYLSSIYIKIAQKYLNN